jgi:hypothetical protein
LPRPLHQCSQRFPAWPVEFFTKGPLPDVTVGCDESHAGSALWLFVNSCVGRVRRVRRASSNQARRGWSVSPRFTRTTQGLGWSPLIAPRREEVPGRRTGGVRSGFRGLAGAPCNPPKNGVNSGGLVCICPVFGDPSGFRGTRRLCARLFTRKTRRPAVRRHEESERRSPQNPLPVFVVVVTGTIIFAARPLS